MSFDIEKDETVVVIGYTPQFEYFCTKCYQLRLSFDKNLITCGNCGNPIIDCVRGNINELDKEKLLRDYKNDSYSRPNSA